MTVSFLQSHYTRAQANSPRPIMTSSGPNPKGSQGTLASQQQSQSQQSQQPASLSHHSPGGSGREQREQRNSRSSRRKGSDSSVPEEEKDRREEVTGRGEDSHLLLMIFSNFPNCLCIAILMPCHFAKLKEITITPHLDLALPRLKFLIACSTVSLCALM